MALARCCLVITALTELQAKEPRKRDRRPIGFIVPDEKKG